MNYGKVKIGGFTLGDYYFKGDGRHKLNRKEKVYEKLKTITRTLKINNDSYRDEVGFDAGYIAKMLNISRNNVSKELNCLLNEGKAIKILGKPVLYLDKIYIESKFNIIIDDPIIANADKLKKLIFKDSFDNLTKENSNKILYEEVSDSNKIRRSVFDNIIGSDDSLKKQVNQAKAAIMYPPKGLHTLLIGPTGTGKTTFAEVMYRYAVEIGKLKPNAPYVIFNCADYAENSQLLISHLFGYVKGAFTGADTEKKGLVDQANGGIFFLDEVHRLSPEGQEMLFTLIDRGKYRRLGESENTRSADILIIAATTENPKSAILGTFLRRIPVVINLPSLSQRSLKERMTLICRFFRDESSKIKEPVTVQKEVLKVLLLYNCPGNIGQLKNDIQLICANAFLEYVTKQQDSINIKLSQISYRFKEGLFSIDNKREELTQNFNLNDFENITFNGITESLDDNLKDVILYDEYKTEEDFYDLILKNAQKFYNEGFSTNQIIENINKQIENRFDSTPSKVKNGGETKADKEVILKIVTPDIIKIVKDSLIETVGILNTSYEKVVYSLALHIETLIERLKSGHIVIHPNIQKAYKDHKNEYAIAQKIKCKLEEKSSIKIPDDEVAFIATFLYSVNMKKEQGNIEVLVITHGYATATNMVQVVKTLLGYDCIHALDMPLEEKAEVALEKATSIVKKIDKGRGVLLLVDMGSLTTFSEIITEKTGIPTRTIRMVSTPMVIEAARKAMMPNMNLDLLVQSVLNTSYLIGEGVKVNNSAAKVQCPHLIYEDRSINMLEETLTFLNVKKAHKTLSKVLEKIALACNKSIDEIIYIKFLFHCSCMIERVIRNEPLPYKKIREIKDTKKNLYNIIKDSFTLVEEVFGIIIPDSELAYIVEMIDTHLNL